ncbi:hypothetical protein HHI36_022010 [Cryptolaemus montrouzieri]|uniref:Ionotropic receptor n=1 Tax=Cryptolaemus montrouzieri TaxID=559131 RepID=A0ABD2MYG0_9CUCU
MLTPVSVLRNLQMISCINNIVHNMVTEDLHTKHILLVKSEYEIAFPNVRINNLEELYMPAGRSENKYHLYIINCEEMQIPIFLESVVHFSFFSVSAIFLFYCQNISVSGIHPNLLTIFLNSTSANLSFFNGFQKYTASPKYSGSCFKIKEIKEEFISAIPKEKLENSAFNICYFFDPPFTIEHSLERKGIILDIQSMILETVGLEYGFTRIQFSNKSGYANIIYSTFMNSSCDYHLQTVVELWKHTFDFSVPHLIDSMNWIVPVPRLVPRWKYVIEMLTVEVLSIWFFTSVVTVLTMYQINRVLYDQISFFYLIQKSFILYKLFLEQNVQFKPRYKSELILFSIIIFGTTIMDMVYKCNIAFFLSGQNFDRDINSLRGVMDQNLKIGFIPQRMEIIKNDVDVLKYTENNFICCDFSNDCLYRAAFSRDIAILRSTMKFLYNSQNLVDEHGRSLVKTFRDLEEVKASAKGEQTNQGDKERTLEEIQQRYGERYVRNSEENMEYASSKEKTSK